VGDDERLAVGGSGDAIEVEISGQVRCRPRERQSGRCTDRPVRADRDAVQLRLERVGEPRFVGRQRHVVDRGPELRIGQCHDGDVRAGAGVVHVPLTAEAAGHEHVAGFFRPRPAEPPVASPSMVTIST
jgi:hypothetical protein